MQGRPDPSFDSYVSLDVTYIENWSLWLDIKIIVHTIGVVSPGPVPNAECITLRPDL